ncbi:hypothetical protein LBMAG53_20390 [Planctomycetota bacterium]|nr:hypothetical protein LBMAG53_20390 [Planctomycetota bacterium]
MTDQPRRYPTRQLPPSDQPDGTMLNQAVPVDPAPLGRPGGMRTPLPINDPRDAVPTMVGSGSRPGAMRTPRPDSELLTVVTAGPDQPTLVQDTGGPRQIRPDTGHTHLHVDGTRAPGTTGSGTHKGEVWSDFEFVRLLGKGGMGAVYLGRQISLDRPVAIKVLPQNLSGDDDFRNRFLLEAKAVARIESPNVIKVYTAGTHQGHHYFVMEFVDGRDLSALLKGGMRPSYEQSLDLMLQAARGLAAAGELGIVHRDIKPGNMMVDKKGVLKIMDFGLVKVVSDQFNKDAYGMTVQGTVMGTVNYFSPEQSRGQTCDQRTDLYALGVVFYELLTGRLPFIGADPTSVIYQHIHVEPQQPRTIDPHIPMDYQRVTLSLMAKRPEDRYQNAADLVSDLERMKHGLPPQRLPGAAAKSGTKASALPMVLGGAAVAAAIAGGVGWWLLGGSAAAPASPSGSGLATDVRPTAETAKTASESAKPVEAVKTTPADTVTSPAGKPPTDVAKPIDPKLADAKPADPKPADAKPPTDAKPPELTKAEPTGPESPKPAGTDSVRIAKLEIQTALAGQRFAPARQALERGRSAAPDDPEWPTLAKLIDDTEGGALVQQALVALVANELDTAVIKAEAARRLVPDSPELKTALKTIAAKQAERDALRAALAEIDGLLAKGQAIAAETAARDLVGRHPNNTEAAAALARAITARMAAESQAAKAKAVTELIDKAELALASRDFDTAASCYESAASQDPANAKAKDGLVAVAKARSSLKAARATFDAAIAAESLAQAETALTALNAVAPAAVALQAANALKDLRQRLADAEAESLAKKNVAAKRILEGIADPARPIATLETDLAAFVAQAGANDPAVPVIRDRIEDRRAIEQFAGGLVGLDQSVGKTDAAGIAQVIADRDFASALSAIGKYPGMTFDSRLLELNRTGDKAVAKVAIRHAIKDLFPETTLRYRLELSRSGQSWQVTSAQLEDAP